MLGSIHNYIYANDGLGRMEAFDEVINILLIKIFDEKEKLGWFFVGKNEGGSFEKRFESLRKHAGVEKIKLSDQSLRYAAGKLQKTKLLNQKNLAGEVFSEFVAKNQKAERGQFFTPREIVKLAVKIAKPKPNDVVLDPACGGGGFLVEANNCQVRGFEINPRVARIAKLGMILSGGDGREIETVDSLRDSRKNLADVVLANPPFGTKGRIRDRKILDNYVLGKNVKSQVPEVLFIERCWRLLKSKGRMAIVLPNGILESSGNQYVRNFLTRKFWIKQVIDLPEKTFSPYGTSVKTSLLILQKRGKRGKVEFGKFVDGKIIEKFGVDQRRLGGRLDYRFNQPIKPKKGRVVQLNEVIELAQKESVKQSSRKVNYVEVSSINTTNLAIDGVRKMRAKDLPRRARYKLKTGDILVSLVGNYLGTKRQAIALVDKTMDGSWCSNGFGVIRSSKMDKYYLLYFLKSEEFLRQVHKHKIQTTIPRVTENDFLKMKIKIADEKEIEQKSSKMKAYIEAISKARKIYGDLM